MTAEAARGFPAFPAGRQLSKRDRSWWSSAWVRAMEGSALDLGRLSRGRTYARQGRVGSITVSPGRISAMVQGSRGDPYVSVVTVEVLTGAEWDRFLDEVAGKAGHIAALLDGDMPQDLVDAAEAAGVPLLPSQGDLEPDCSCPDWGYPCKHAAALCYQTSWLLDEDPFVLLLLRGRGERELMAELRQRNAAQAGPSTNPAAPAPRPGVPASDVWAAADPALLTEDPPLPPDAVLPEPPWTDLPAPPGLDPAVLTRAAQTAATRARDLLADLLEDPEPDGDPEPPEDTNTKPPTSTFARLVRTPPPAP